MKHWASVCLGGKGLLVPPEECQVLAFLPSMGSLPFFLFDGGARAVLLSWTMEIARPPCSVRSESFWPANQQGLKPGIHLDVLWYATGTVWQVELFGANQAAVALGSTCIGAWASWSHGSCCQLRRTEPAGRKNSRS